MGPFRVYGALYTAAIGTAWSLSGSPRNGQQRYISTKKHSPCWQYIHTVSQLWTFLERTDIDGGCVRSAAPPYQLAAHPPSTHVSNLFVTVLSANVNIGPVAYYGAVKCSSGSRQLRDLALQVFLIKEHNTNTVLRTKHTVTQCAMNDSCC